MVRVDLGSVHRGSSIPPSVPIGPPAVVVDHQPFVDRVLLQKEASKGTICPYRATRGLVREVAPHGLGGSHVTGGSRQPVL